MKTASIKRIAFSLAVLAGILFLGQQAQADGDAPFIKIAKTGISAEKMPAVVLSHEAHIKHADDDCSVCHTEAEDKYLNIDTLAPAKRQGAVHAACASCHIQKGKGPLLAQCSSCHSQQRLANLVSTKK